MKYVQVIFKGNFEKLYDYITDLDLRKGEPVVVPTGSTFSVATVVNVIDKSEKAVSWVVQKVDVEAHEARLKSEKDLEDLLS